MIISVAGLNKVGQYTDNVKLLMDKIIEDNAYPISVSIVPEPTNQYDPLALQVKANDLDVGYVSKKFQPTLQNEMPEVFKKETKGKIFSWGQAEEGFYYINVELVND